MNSHSPIPLGNAVFTSAGKLSYKGIIHVASINLFWRSSELTIRNSVVNAMNLATLKGFRSIAFPVLGSGSGGFPQDAALRAIQSTFDSLESDLRVIIVLFDPKKFGS